MKFERWVDMYLPENLRVNNFMQTFQKFIYILKGSYSVIWK